MKIAVLSFFLTGCGFIAGLRTDYELGDASLEAGAEAGDASSDAPADAAADSAPPCPMPTDTMCGGPMCPKCGINKSCVMNSDCESNNCSNMKCRP